MFVKKLRNKADTLKWKRGRGRETKLQRTDIHLGATNALRAETEESFFRISSFFLWFTAQIKCSMHMLVCKG